MFIFVFHINECYHEAVVAHTVINMYGRSLNCPVELKFYKLLNLVLDLAEYALIFKCYFSNELLSLNKQLL